MKLSKVGHIKTERKRSTSVPLTLTLISTVLFCQRGLAATEPNKPNAGDNETMNVDYNPMFIRGSDVDVSRFSESNPVSPGQYDVTVVVNGENRGKQTIAFMTPPNKTSAEPCFTAAQLEQLGLVAEKTPERLQAAESGCARIDEWISLSKSSYNSGDFVLDLTIPQLYVKVLPRGYIDPSLWEKGDTVGFLDYTGNFYSSFQGASAGRDRNSDNSGNVMLSAGFNYGDWRFRKKINSSWQNNSSLKTDNLYGYAARDITSLKSELVLGEANTVGDVFDSYGLRGVLLHSEDSMLPDSLRNYSPILRGVAETNARVRVMQRGQMIFETVVPPGPFEINDANIGQGTDVTLIVTEADGRERQQTISFSVPPILLREGVSNFAVSAGQLKDNDVDSYPAILQGTYRRGMSNSWTLYGGVQVAAKYIAAAVGSAFNTPIGGIAFDITHAKSDLRDGESASGNSYQVTYSKYLDSTDTNVSLAAYRYSSSGFYSFRDASRQRDGNVSTNNVDYRARQRFSATLSQKVTDSITLFFNGSLYTYWDGRGSARQYSVTFNQSLRHFSYGVTAARTQNQDGNEESNLLLSVNVPLSKPGYTKPLFSSVYSTASRDGSGNTQFQTLVNGSQGERNELTYGVGGSFGSSPNTSSATAVTGNMNYRSGTGSYGISGSANNRNTQQFSLFANGSLVAHKGGVTAGPTIGDAPFAIIGAPGATGARIENGQGAEIDSRGYAIMPSLTPYRKNTVSLDARGLPDTVDVLENEKVVVPRQGAAISVDMKTISGSPMVLTVRDEKQKLLPIGTELQDEKGISKGIIGQAGQLFIRGWQPEKEALYAVIDGVKLRCKPTSSQSAKLGTTEIIQMEMTCLRNGQ
ncbi:fimbria/pilus outer membrane usher protein [Serratia sp. UGAL515B_01]|uniref:fimbria/pilus outer membrane usher protein n=1 Tax=Serratia sp. UGAL515B_01 TaxID=2986763 RepID=UPI002952DD07|nr:fimbria/pilus outer membrane usher protein [Serratia sp. UGAL515B_01]WON77481.1 fimbrial biogenesis outer membrane usher protein [Serratia sp. UGAL515B_01]